MWIAYVGLLAFRPQIPENSVHMRGAPLFDKKEKFKETGWWTARVCCGRLNA